MKELPSYDAKKQDSRKFTLNKSFLQQQVKYHSYCEVLFTTSGCSGLEKPKHLHASN